MVCQLSALESFEVNHAICLAFVEWTLFSPSLIDTCAMSGFTDVIAEVTAVFAWR